MEPFDFTHFDFINRANADYIDQLYQRYQQDPRSVESHWRAFFAGFEAGGGRQISSTAGPAAPTGDWAPHRQRELRAGRIGVITSTSLLRKPLHSTDPAGAAKPAGSKAN